MTPLQRQLINRLQTSVPLCDEPYKAIAEELGSDEETVIDELKAMLADKTLSRFGPMYHAEELGGGLTLAAMAIPEQDFEKVTEQVNSFPEVAHNYERDHELNMWFVLATETPEGIAETIKDIEQKTGYPVYNMPKQEEFYVGLHFAV